MGRKKSNAASGLAGLVILCITSLVLFTIYVREDNGGPLHTVQLGAAEVLRPVRSLLNLAASPVQGTGDRIGNAFDGRREADLERQAREYEEDAAEAAGLRQENERLRRLVEADDPTFDYAPLARVVAPVGGQLSDKVVIDVGTEDGVKPEQPVVVGDNVLIGRTTSTVTPHTAEVMLVTDQDFAAGVRLVPPAAPAEPPEGEAPYGQGLLQTGWEGYLGVNYVDLEARVEKGDFVVTSGRAGDRELLFPPGLLVGTVETVTSLDIDQYQKIVVEPTVRPADLQEVRVVVGW